MLFAIRVVFCGALAAVTATLPAVSVHAELISARAALSARSPQPVQSLEAVQPAESVAVARERVQGLLTRADVAAELTRFGVDPGEARRRVAALSDPEVRALDGRLAEVPAGQGFVGFVVGVVVVTLAVLLFADLLGYTDVFPFIDPLPRGNQPDPR